MAAGRWTAVIVTPGNRPPLASFTMPVSVPVAVLCASTGETPRARNRTISPASRSFLSTSRITYRSVPSLRPLVEMKARSLPFGEKTGW